MLRGAAKLTISEETVIEAMQEWARVNFLAGNVPKVTGIKVSNASSFGSATYELSLEEVKDVITDKAPQSS